jgi:hypothetical protein
LPGFLVVGIAVFAGLITVVAEVRVELFAGYG